MKEKIKKIQKSSSKKEEEISERICKKIKEEKVSDSELDEMIFKEIENNIFFSEDWQKHYSKERIKDKIKEKKYNFLPTTLVKRFLNFILDIIIFNISSFIFGIVLGITGLYFIIEGMGDWFLGITIVVLYYVIFESIWSKTPAKFITKTRVITEYGEKPNFKTILIRTLVRFVPFEAFSFLTSGRPRGWHDRWSKTIVIDDMSTSKKGKESKNQNNEIAINEFRYPKSEKKLSDIQESKIFYCSKCGNRLDGDSKFCSKCGVKI